MNKITAGAAILLTAVLWLIPVTAGGCSRSGAASGENAERTKTAGGEREGLKETNGGTENILIVYFSHSGNTREIAGQIREKTGGDIFEIQVSDPYPAQYDAVVERGRKERDGGERPALASKVANMERYSTVFIGYPNWFGSMPMALYTFLESHDLSGKTVVPFCTHGGGGIGGSVADLKKLCPNSTVAQEFAVRGADVKSAQRQVSEWLKTTGAEKQNKR